MRHTLVGLAVLAGCSRVVGLQPKTHPPIVATATPFTLPSHTGERVELATALTKSDVVLVFYRGHW